MAVTATSTNPINWAVSQGTSFRRMHVRGNVSLWDGVWSSGGFMADSKIDGRVNSGTHSIWITGKDGTETTHVINGTGETVNRFNKKATVD